MRPGSGFLYQNTHFPANWLSLAQPEDLERFSIVPRDEPDPPPPDPTSATINMERDRRLQSLSFAGKSFDFCDGKGSDLNIAGAGTLALAAIISGAQPGDLRWADPNADFLWVAQDNSSVPMDAQTTLAFAKTAAEWKAKHIYAARQLKNMSPIPADYADNARWPS